jgi:hypothetical protein
MYKYARAETTLHETYYEKYWELPGTQAST